MHGLVFLVLQLYGHNGETVQKETKIWAFASLDDQFGDKSNSVLSVMLVGNTFAGAGFWIIELELQPPHGEAMPDDQPQGGNPQFILQCLENFIPGVGAVIRFQTFKGLFLSRLEKGDQMVLGKIIFRVGDLILLKHTISVFADEIVRNMTLEFLFRAFKHGFYRDSCCISSSTGCSII